MLSDNKLDGLFKLINREYKHIDECTLQDFLEKILPPQKVKESDPCSDDEKKLSDFDIIGRDISDNDIEAKPK